MSVSTAPSNEESLDEATTRAVEAERIRITGWLSYARLGGITLWFLVCFYVTFSIGRPEARTQLPAVAVYLVLSIALLVLRRFVSAVRRWSYFSVAVVDAPMTFVLHALRIQSTPTPRQDAMFALASFAVLVSLSVLSLSRRGIIAAAVACSAFEVVLLLQAGPFAVQSESIFGAVAILGFIAAVSLVGTGRLLSLAREIVNGQAASARLGRYFSPLVAEQILKLGAASTSEHREVSILFSDIRDFTGLSDRDFGPVRSQA